MMETRSGLLAVIAHQGGWDEILLFFGLPIVLFVVLRYFGIRRERREAAEGTDETDEAD